MTGADVSFRPERTSCVLWPAVSALALFGLFHPLRWLPVMCLANGHKVIRLAFIAVPLWQAGTLWGTPTGEIASTVLALSLLAAVVPRGYAWRTYVAWLQRVDDARPSPRDAGHFPQSAAASAAQ